MTFKMKRYNVRRIPDSTVPIDWALADVLADFTFPWEETTAPETVFRALWDESHLYFRFDCVDEDLVLATGETLKDRVLGSDRVEIFFTPDLSLTPYYCFEMSPLGEALVYQARFYREVDWEWNCPGLEIEARIESPRYWLEGRLPLERLLELGILKPQAREFYAGVYRGEFSHLPDQPVKTGWMPWVNPRTERPDFHVPESFGIFELLPS
jgi:Carbohydrate family 9 binding domain-like